jgi:ParB family transcriptional regulator, chromosome partitioning protein
VPSNKLADQIADNIKTIPIMETTDEPDDIQATSYRRMKSAKWIPIDIIKTDPGQPRKIFDEISIRELGESIEEFGVRQPIVVEKEGSIYRIISGERRYRASKLKGLKEMPCIVQEKADSTLRLAQQIIENIHREDFSPIDKAQAILQYKSLLGDEVSWNIVEKKLSLSKTRRKQFVRLLNLPEQIQNEVVALGSKPAKNQITEKHARALLMLNDNPEKQIGLFNRIKNGNETISGDEAIDLVKQIKGGRSKKTFKLFYKSREELIEKLEKKLAILKNDQMVT